MTMQHNDDAFATMLLMSQINPQREELVLPLSIPEWHQLRERAGHSELMSLGGMLRSDMSELMLTLGCTEAEAYRLCVLLGRTLPLSISFEQMRMSGIEVMTYEERPYPELLRECLGSKAPPMLYLCGRPELFRQPAVAVLGAASPKGAMLEKVRLLARQAVDLGYVVIVDGQNGAGMVALDEAVSCGGYAAMVMAGELMDAAASERIAGQVRDRRVALISQYHPEAPYTLSHAIQRNKMIYALSQAAFVFSCDEEKGATWAGATEALRAKYCNFVYVLDTDQHSGNRPLLQRGAVSMPDFERIGVDVLSGFWQSATAEQTCLFDWRDPI